jgi:hypothetical protein
MAGEEVAHRHRATAFGLDLKQRQVGAASGRNLQVIP